MPCMRMELLRVLKAAVGTFGIHVALSILVAALLVFMGEGERLPKILGLYVCVAWLPLAVWVFPVLRRQIR